MNNYESFYNLFEDFGKTVTFLTLGTVAAYAFVCFYVYMPMKKQGDEFNEEDKKKEKSLIETYCSKFKKEYKILELKEISDEFKKDLNNKSVVEETPQGKVIMTYNYKNNEFLFFADTKEITYNILEVVSKKFVITNDCKIIYKEMPASFSNSDSDNSSEYCSDSEDSLNSDCTNNVSNFSNDSDKNEEEKSDQEQEVANSEENDENVKKTESEKETESENNNVFASFKPYNAVINENNMEELGYIIKKDINKYKYGGRLDDYNKKKEERPIMNINFETFKEMLAQNNITIEDKKTS